MKRLSTNRLLLDTHIFLWMVSAPERLSPAVRQALLDPAHEVFFSAVVAWEIAVKRAKGKLVFNHSPIAAARDLRLVDLPISAAHCDVSASLAAHHRDPFDRLLIAQAETESLVLISSDRVMASYNIALLRG